MRIELDQTSSLSAMSHSTCLLVGTRGSAPMSILTAKCSIKALHLSQVLSVPVVLRLSRVTR